MAIYDKEKMLQKPVYPTKQTPSYADWALFNMGKELEANGSAYDEANTVILQTMFGIVATFIDRVLVTVEDDIATSITLNETEYILDFDTVEEKYKMYSESISDDNFVGYIYFYGDIEQDAYIGANVCLSGNRYLYYGLIDEVVSG